MTEVERIRITKRLTAGRDNDRKRSDTYIHDALRCMVDAGACRIGVRRTSACDLAPPLARMIDHTALKPDTTESAVKELCREALKHCFASVCIPPCYTALAARQLQGSEIATCTVIGFPHGANHSAVKTAEARQAVEDGASELDMVLNVGLLKSKRYDSVEDDIRSVVRASRSRAVVKVILETALLTDEEKVIACCLAQNAEADFVKTSTGFSSGGATASDIALMRTVVGQKMGVKASGGVRTRSEAETMVAHGATRIGASASVAIVS